MAKRQDITYSIIQSILEKRLLWNQIDIDYINVQKKSAVWIFIANKHNFYDNTTGYFK